MQAAIRYQIADRSACLIGLPEVQESRQRRELKPNSITAACFIKSITTVTKSRILMKKLDAGDLTHQPFN